MEGVGWINLVQDMNKRQAVVDGNEHSDSAWYWNFLEQLRNY